VASTRGVPPIQQAVALTDRRHVLTQDAEGRVELWDVTAGRVVRDLGRRPLQEAERALFQPTQRVETWFQIDVRLGSLAGHMETPQCFAAEVYAQDLGHESAPADLRVNYGERMLRALFRRWAEGRRVLERQQRAAERRRQRKHRRQQQQEEEEEEREEGRGGEGGTREGAEGNEGDVGMHDAEG
jgi:hypothetical protein